MALDSICLKGLTGFGPGSMRCMFGTFLRSKHCRRCPQRSTSNLCQTLVQNAFGLFATMEVVIDDIPPVLRLPTEVLLLIAALLDVAEVLTLRQVPTISFMSSHYINLTVEVIVDLHHLVQGHQFTVTVDIIIPQATGLSPHPAWVESRRALTSAGCANADFREVCEEFEPRRVPMAAFADV